MPDCEPWEVGDLVHIRAVPPLAGEKPMVIRGAPVTPGGRRYYEIRFLEDDLSNYRKGYTLTTGVTESEIREGKCRVPGTPKWKLSPEKEAMRLVVIPSRPAPTASAAVIPDFDRFKDVVDTLLGQLPEDRVKSFAKTPDMTLYTRVIKGGQTPAESKRFVEVVDTLLGELPEKVVQDFVKTPDYETYKHVIEAAKKV
jgi:hypothetical protein